MLVDCGMFQGEKHLRVRNWTPWPFEPANLDAVLLTHAHLDHSGMLPVLHRDGFDKSVHCTESTAELAKILLTDSGRIHEDDARHANRHGYSRHRPALPLYTENDAHDSLTDFVAQPFEAEFEPAPGITARFRRAGHILGAASLELRAGGRTIVFSGDLGRADDPVMYAPASVPSCDYLVVESTYGDREHVEHDAAEQLLDAIEHTRKRGGMVLIPAFAVGRAQLMLYLLWQLKESGALGQIPIFLDSPMAIDATELYRSRHDDHKLSDETAAAMCAVATCITNRDESRALNKRRGPMIVISASGMMSGGRILHHLRVRGGDPKNLILFTGYQAAGTRGAAILSGAREVKIHGLHYPIRAEVREIASLSAHADRSEIMDWVRPALEHVRGVFVTHGEPAAASALAREIGRCTTAKVNVPALGDRVALD